MPISTWKWSGRQGALSAPGAGSRLRQLQCHPRPWIQRCAPWPLSRGYGHVAYVPL